MTKYSLVSRYDINRTEIFLKYIKVKEPLYNRPSPNDLYSFNPVILVSKIRYVLVDHRSSMIKTWSPHGIIRHGPDEWCQFWHELWNNPKPYPSTETYRNTSLKTCWNLMVVTQAFFTRFHCNDGWKWVFLPIITDPNHLFRFGKKVIISIWWNFESICLTANTEHH